MTHLGIEGKNDTVNESTISHQLHTELKVISSTNQTVYKTCFIGGAIGSRGSILTTGIFVSTDCMHSYFTTNQTVYKTCFIGGAIGSCVCIN